MADKTVKAKQPEKAKKAEGTSVTEKPKLFQKSRTSDKEKEKDRDNKPKQPNAFTRWWRETVGELRKVSWPSREDSTRLTMIVLAVMVVMGSLLGILDFVFSRLIALLVS